MPPLKLRFSESQIISWAEKYEYVRDETELLDLAPHVQSAGYLTKAELYQVARWKSPRSARHIAGNDAAYVEEVTALALAASEERTRIEALTLLDGVRWPSASVILHFFHDAPYPILDYRALWSLGQKTPKKYDFSIWWAYVEYCRKIARRNSVDMRTLDRALWQYSKTRQRK